MSTEISVVERSAWAFATLLLILAEILFLRCQRRDEQRQSNDRFTRVLNRCDEVEKALLADPANASAPQSPPTP